MMSCTVMLWAITSTLPLPARTAALLLKAFFPRGTKDDLGQGMHALDPVHEFRSEERSRWLLTCLASFPSFVN